ncbi:hypothetical protein L195_g059419, partial [Trifolium pratense]
LYGRSTGDEDKVRRGNAALSAAITALTAQMAAFSTQLNNNAYNNVNNNRNHPNRGGEHTHGESDLEYYERRYYKRLKDDY